MVVWYNWFFSVFWIINWFQRKFVFVQSHIHLSIREQIDTKKIFNHFTCNPVSCLFNSFFFFSWKLFRFTSFTFWRNLWRFYINITFNFNFRVIFRNFFIIFRRWRINMSRRYLIVFRSERVFKIVWVGILIIFNNWVFILLSNFVLLWFWERFL